ncbi:hypothetical protein FB562_2190 [Homoserinimonas aerilata]|uniref:Uncharacterized protein n=1 Tax=Homoserinimonas aerilata TaxID=1162970 RepID=A0A542YEZ4_9MICO|nr:hypothetical protein FB562_2190 [Homoserinimonas aerilata]
MTEIDEPPMAEYDVTCTTDGCENAGITIRVPAAAENPTVVCGPCGIVLDAVAP